MDSMHVYAVIAFQIRKRDPDFSSERNGSTEWFPWNATSQILRIVNIHTHVKSESTIQRMCRPFLRQKNDVEFIIICSRLYKTGTPTWFIWRAKILLV